MLASQLARELGLHEWFPTHGLATSQSSPPYGALEPVEPNLYEYSQSSPSLASSGHHLCAVGHQIYWWFGCCKFIDWNPN